MQSEDHLARIDAHLRPEKARSCHLICIGMQPRIAVTITIAITTAFAVAIGVNRRVIFTIIAFGSKTNKLG